MAITLALTDPHPVFLQGLKQLLASEPYLKTLARCGSAGEKVWSVKKNTPDWLTSHVTPEPFSRRSGISNLIRSAPLFVSDFFISPPFVP